jgi:hypothetical protein
MASSTLLALPFNDRMISLLGHLHQLIQQVSHSSVGVLLSKRFAAADTGATDYMLSDKAAFISYKSISKLQVWMGNNFFIPVLGQGTAIVSLNGQRVLICNVLHVPGLLVPLHSLCVHLTQCGCTSAIWLFWAAAGSLMRCFYCNCGHKLFGTAISKYLIDNQSKIAAAPAKWQSSNGLVKSHWKTMVHMARAYLTEKQMSWTFWFYAVVHLAQMMNAIPGTYLGHLT